MPRLKVDLHSHTPQSDDCRMSYEQIVEGCRRRGIDALAVTDHGTMAGAFELRRRAPFLVIPSCEIKTERGELIGLFLQEPVPGGMSLADTAAAIREQGGVVYLPHPFDRLRRSAVIRFVSDMDALLDHIDVVEGINARCIFPADNRRAQAWAARHGLPLGAGSDAHTMGELGRAYVQMEAFDGPMAFLESIRGGRLGGGISSPLVHVPTTLIKWRRRAEGH